MNLTCPAYDKTGGNGDFRFLGDQKMLCRFCNNQLDVANYCTKCKKVMITRWPLGRKLNPFGSLVVSFKALTGSLNEDVVVCSACGRQAPLKEFPMVLSSGGKDTINERY